LTAHFEYEPKAQFYYAYHSLVLYSFGLENAIEVSAPAEHLPFWAAASTVADANVMSRTG
jgi:hypothetical protein